MSDEDEGNYEGEKREGFKNKINTIKTSFSNIREPLIYEIKNN